MTVIPDTYAATAPWQARAVCASLDPDLFQLPTSGSQLPDEDLHAGQIAEAKTACRVCPVKAQCLAAALAAPRSQDMWAIAGDTTPRERAAIRRRRQPARGEGRPSRAGGRP